MVSDLRSKIAILIFCLIPAGGIYYYVQHWKIMSNEIRVDVSALPQEISLERKQFQLSGFHLVSAQPTRSRTHEYVCIQSKRESSDLPPTFVVLSRQTSLDGSIMDRISDGVVDGLASSYGRVSREYAERIGLPFPETAPESIICFSVDREYLTSIVGTTIGLSIFGLLFLVYACSKFEESNASKNLRHNAARSQVALYRAISKAETI